MQSPTIALDQVSLDFDGKPLFADLSLRFEGGRMTGLLGPSGCGKSTLLKMIAGSANLPFEGTIRFDPQPESLRQVAWMGQNDLLLPWLSLLDNVLLGPRLRGELTKILQQQAISLLAAAGLEGAALALPATLSGGMRQRGALLRTLMEACPTLLMDEPFSALDALTRVRLQDLACRLTKGRTVVLVTHDPLEALRLCDRILVLDGTPAAVTETIEPDGPPPRNLTNQRLASQYADLMDLLLSGKAA